MLHEELLLILFLVSIVIKCTCTSVSIPIHVGILVNTFNKDHTINKDGQQELQSFLMRLEDVNLGPGHHFEFVLSNAHGFFNSASQTYTMVNTAFNGTVHAVISALPDKESMITLQMLEDEKILTIIASAGSEEMSSGIDYPYKLRLVASEAYDGIVMQQLIHDGFDYNKVAIFFTTDRSSVGNSMNFIKVRSGRKFHILSENELDAYDEDYSEYINSAKESGANVFVMFMESLPCAKLLIQGYKLGLFSENARQVIFTIEKCSGEELIQSIKDDYPEQIPNIPKLLKGVIGIRYDPRYTLTHSQKGKDFMSKFKSRPATNNCSQYYQTGLWTGSVQNTTVGAATDDNGMKLLYRDNATSTVCGLDYSTYNPTNIYEFAPHVYDSVHLLESIYRKLLISEGKNLNAIGAENMMEAAFSLPEYEGVTGNIKIFNGIEEVSVKHNGLYGRGDREIGHTFRITNYNSKVNAFVDVGRINHGYNFQLCDDQVKDTLIGEYHACEYMVEFNSPDNTRPSDTRPDIRLESTDEIQAFLHACGIIGIIYTVAVGSVLFYRRHSKLMKASQPQMVGIVLAGEVLAFIRVFFGGMHPTPSSCMSMFWFGHLSYWIVFGALTMKTWRVYKIISNTSLKRVKITTWDVLQRIWILIAFAIVYLIVVQTVAVSELHVKVITVSNQSTFHTACGFKYPQFEITLYVLEACLLVYGANMCNQVKDAPSAINESKPISASLSYIALISAIVLPFVSLIDLDNETIQIITSLSFFVAAMISTSLIFLPKVFILGQGKDIDWNEKKKTSQNEALYADSKVGTELDSALIEHVTEHLHGKTVDDKYAIAQLQVVWWKNLLMKLEEKRTSSQSSNNTHSRSSMTTNMKDADEEPILLSTELETNTAVTIA